MKFREQLVPRLVEKAFELISNRQGVFENCKMYYWQGGKTQKPINKIYAYVDTLSSFLFSAETTTFNFVTHSDFPEEMQQLLPPLRKVLLTTWQDIKGDVIFDFALHQSIVYGSYFIKVMWFDGIGIRLFPVHPKDIGVANPSIPNVVDQEWIVHKYKISKSEMKRLLFLLNKSHLLNKIDFHEESKSSDDGLMKIINASMQWGGQVDMDTEYNVIDLVETDDNEGYTECYEIWVKDDDLRDYRVITYHETVGILMNRPNPYLKHETPFININLAPYNFYGFPEIVQLFPLQDWLSERVDQLKQLMMRQIYPSLAITGSTFSANDEQLLDFYYSQGFLTLPDPAAKIQPLVTPTNLQAVFGEFNEINQFFYEMSGIRDVMTGGLPAAARTAEQTQMLSLLASSRVKKKALILQTIIEKLAYLILKLIITHEDLKLSKSKIQAAIIPIDELSVKVDAHSLSPIFAQEFKQDVYMLFKAGIIAGDDVLELLNFPMAEYLIAKLQARQQAQSQMQFQLEALKHGKKT